MLFSFEQLCDAIPGAFLLLSLDGTILAVNRAACELLGKPSSELCGKLIQRLTHSNSEKAEDYLRLCGRTSSLTVGALKWRMDDGASLSTPCEGRLISAEPDQPRLVLLRLASREQKTDRFVALNDKISQLGREVEAKTAAEAALQQSESRFRFLADFIPQILWRARPDGSVDYCNQRWFDYTGLTFKQTEGSGWEAVVHSDDLPLCSEGWNRAISTGEPFEIECRLRRSEDDSYRWHLARAIALRDATGAIVKWFGSSTDIHDNKMAQNALLKSEKLAAAGRLAATIAHEINNPLEAVINLLYLAQRGLAPGDRIREYLALADQELARVAEIARQTLGFYRDTSLPVSFSLTDVIDDVARLYSRKVHRRHMQLETDCDSALKVHAVQGEIRQVLANLVSNAIDACHPGGKIGIRAYRTHAWNDSMCPGVRIVVADTGAGIEPHVLAHIFDPFFSTKKDVGTGLGLWISREIIHKHKGSIRVRSRHGRRSSGSVFSIFLPLTQGTSADARAA